MKQLPWLLFLLPVICCSQAVKFREYKKGQNFQYRLTTESSRNGQADSKTVSISKHKIVEDSGRLVERINWISKTSFSQKDTLYLDSLAQKVPPYELSLQRGGSLNIPPLLIPEMTGEITDLHTFYVAVSPSLHVQQLSPTHLSFKDSVLRGHFADGIMILSGEDCIQVTQKLLVRDDEVTIIKTTFQPPIEFSIIPLIDTIRTQVFNSPNNFQMVRKGVGDKVNLLWGVEQFTITSTLNSHSGQILEAEMENVLELRMRYNSSPDLKTYEGEIPLTIRRSLKLELVK